VIDSVNDNGVNYDTKQFLKRKSVSGKRRVCALTRVSTQHEQQTGALENQNQWIKDEISRHSDWVFDFEKDLYTDNGVSGTSTKNRIDFNKMISKALAGEYDLIVTREVCRFMRNARLTLNLVNDLENAGVEVYFLNDTIQTFNKDDYMKLSFMSTYAEQESRKISERVLCGQETSRKNGVLYGNGNILGYDLVKGEKSKYTKYVINEEQARTVRKIYELSLSGYGMKKIKHYLVENGYKNSLREVKWYESTIERILRNRTYSGVIEYLKSYTIDPLSHERVSQPNKIKRPRQKGNYEPIIQSDMWDIVQEKINSRVNRDFITENREKKNLNGKVINKDVYCRKMRCGCGRRLKKDLGRVDNTGTYRCYSLIDDGSEAKRLEKSIVLNDNCIIHGIIDWKLDLFTLKVFNELSYNVEEIKSVLLNTVEKYYVGETKLGYHDKDKYKLEKEIQRLKEHQTRLLDLLEDGVIEKNEYLVRKKKNECEISEKILLLKKVEKIKFDIDAKNECIKEISKYLDSALTFPGIEDNVVKIPNDLIEIYVNSIKSCANNVFEYNIRVNPQSEVNSPLVCPDEEYNSLIHPATKNLDNSNDILLAEFIIDYDMAKAYANKLSRKVVRVHWETPATIKIYASI